MNYIVFDRDGSLLTQNMEYYVQQGNQGDTIFVGFLGANLFDTTIALFTLPDAEHTTNSVAGILTSKRIEIEGEEVEVPGWTITLTQAQTLYNGMLMTAIRILRDEQVIVSYPFYIVINETGVRPDSDTGVTIEEINSYLLQLQQVARGCLKFVDIDESTATIGSVEDLVGLDLDFAMIFNGCLSFCKLEKDINDDYTFSVCNPYGVFKAEDLARSSTLSNLVWTDIDTINDNCIEIPYQGGVYSGTLSAEDLIKAAKNNAVISYNNGYYQKFSQTSTQATFYRVTVGVNAAGIVLLEQKIVVTLASGNWETTSQLTSIYTQAQVNSLIQDVNTSLSSKEDLSNKVTSIDNESTDTQYPSAKCVYDNIQTAIEVANGKCKTWTISYQETEPTQGTFVANKYMRADGTKIATWADFEEYITLIEGMPTPFLNSSFNSQSLQLTLVGYIVTTDNYVLINGMGERDGCKNGDNIMVVQTEVPDRWYYAGILYALETSKIDLASYVTTNTEQSISGKKHFTGTNVLAISGAGWNTDWYLNFNNTNLEFKYGGSNPTTHYVMGSGNGSQPKAFYTPSGKDLGISSSKWKDLYLSGVIYLGGATELTQASDDSLQITLSGDGKSVKPSWDGHYNLGASGYNWKDLYLSGALKIASATNTFELTNAGNYISFKQGVTTLADWGSSGMATRTHIYPSTTGKDLGTSTNVWNYLYVNNLSNGTGDMTSHCNLLPSANGALDLGSTAYLWSNVFTDALRMVGSTSQVKMTYDNDWAVSFKKSTDGGTTWSSMFYFSGEETYTRKLFPMGDKVYDLGYSAAYWKDLYLAGGVNFKDGSSSNPNTRLWKMCENNWGTLDFYTSNDGGTTWGNRFSFQNGGFLPTSANMNLGLGSGSQRWGSVSTAKLTDGTNETTVANINDNFAPKYDNTATYSVGDYVTYNGRLYTCTTAVTTAEDFDDTKWSATSMSAFTPSTSNLVTLDTDQQIKGGKFFYREGANGTPLPLRIQGFHNKTWGFETDYSWDVLKIGHADVNGTNISNIVYYYTLTNSAFYGLLSTVGQSQVGKDLGTSSYPWKDAYVSGKIYYINNGNTEPAFDFSNGYISVERNMYFHGSDAIPQGNCQLGTTSNKWKDLYLSGVLSDGTNSISIAQIVAGAGGSGATKKTITLTNDTWTQAQLQDVYTNAYDVVEIISSTGSNNIYKQYNNKTQDNVVTYVTLPEPSNGIDLYVFSLESEYALDVVLGVPLVSGTNNGTNWTSLTIGEDTYAIPQGGGSNVVANPTLAGTETKLTGIEIGNTKYKVVSPVSLATVITEGESSTETEDITGVMGDTSKQKAFAGGNGNGGTPCWWLADVPAFKNAIGNPLNSISLYSDTAGVIWLYQADIELDCTNNSTMPTLASQADSSGTLFLKLTVSSADASSGQKLTFLLDGTDSRVEFATGVSINPICPKTIGLSKATGSKVAFNNGANAVLDTSGLGIAAGFGQASGPVTANYSGYYQCFMLEFNYTKTTVIPGETTTELKMTMSDGSEVSCELGDIEVELDQEYLAKYPLQGKKVSIIGDSISTYSGYLPSGYNSRYPAGVIQNVNQTWWYPLIQDTKMTLLRNCSYNGSTVSGQQNTNHSAGYSTTGTSPYPGCGDKRISDLANGSETPDIVICFIGINDFGANRSVPVGTYDGLSSIPADSSTGMADFSSAYGLMIKKIQAAYPDAIIYCCTLPPTTGSTYNPNGTFPTKNTTTGACLADFNDAIRTLADNMNCRVMEFAKAGITYWNNSTYMEDGVHPSIIGHKALKRMAESTLIRDFTLTEEE